MRSVVVASAAAIRAGTGASWSPKWSGMNSVEKPRSSTLRALATHSSRDRALAICAPKRNFFVLGMARTLIVEFVDMSAGADHDHVIYTGKGEFDRIELGHLMPGMSQSRQIIGV